MKPPSFLRPFEKGELFAGRIPVLLGTVPKAVATDECLFYITELLNSVHNKEFVPVSDS